MGITLGHEIVRHKNHDLGCKLQNCSNDDGNQFQVVKLFASWFTLLNIVLLMFIINVQSNIQIIAISGIKEAPACKGTERMEREHSYPIFGGKAAVEAVTDGKTQS